MLGTQNLLLFVATGILLNLTPGQDTFYILGRSIAQGRRAGVISVLGITSGCTVHTCAAAFGLSAILAASANAFLLVKMAGASYLTYLGVKMILAFLFLGALFMTTGTLWCLVLAWFGAAMSRRLRENPSAGSKLTRASGAMFLGLGVKLAISR